MLKSFLHVAVLAGGLFATNPVAEAGGRPTWRERRMTRVEARLTPEQIERRAAFLNAVAAGLEGAAAGLSQGANSWQPAAPTPLGPAHQPNPGWAFRREQIRSEINRPYLPRD